MRVVSPIAGGRHVNADSLRDFCKVANKAGVPGARRWAFPWFLPSGEGCWNPGQSLFQLVDRNKGVDHLIALQQGDKIGHFWRGAALFHRLQSGLCPLRGPAKLPERLVGGAIMTRSAMDRPDYLYRRLKLVPELIDRGPIPEPRTKLHEYRFRLGFGDKVSDNNLLAMMLPLHLRQ